MSTVKLNTVQIGHSLSKHARKADFSAQRGLVGELFPFLVEASERMSSRAISKFLVQEHCVKLSYATINKALNDPKRYWRLYFDSFLNDAKFIEYAIKIPRAEFLLKPKESFEHFDLTIARQLNQTLVISSLDSLANARDRVIEKWFSLSPDTLKVGIPHLKKYLEELRLQNPSKEIKS